MDRRWWKQGKRREEKKGKTLCLFYASVLISLIFCLGAVQARKLRSRRRILLLAL